ncbi:MAG: NUDIX hydrolase [Candidatus Methanomethylicota archaeon]|uniref:NUDIX hydrolase n=1 Tax=Thermoproteota archaeon TaxID=2056631 RepID=A0A497F2H8_9CREN|nr:MAG: NUDIX hydrolase [Candidatus Verstraetearchaeota archaeon]
MRQPLLAVDAVILVNEHSIVLVKRKKPPFEGFWALPGGFVEYGETVEAAVKREVFEETGLKVEVLDLIGVFSKPDRDPRGHVISIAFLTKAIGGTLKEGEEVGEVRAFKVDSLPENLAFDHGEIIREALKKLR